jgi:nicotinate-nucleotide adenylyltransferase
MNKQKIIMYAGTFNPVHYGHIQTALNAIENINKLEPDSVFRLYFYPINKSLIENKPYYKLEDRIKMIKIALKDYKNMDVVDNDLRDLEPRTHFHRIQELKGTKYYPDYWLIGSDAYRKEVYDIFFENFDATGIKLVVNERVGFKVKKKYKKDHIIINGPDLNAKISSTLIRESMKSLQGISKLIPHNVLEYIVKVKFYEEWKF